MLFTIYDSTFINI